MSKTNKKNDFSVVSEQYTTLPNLSEISLKNYFVITLDFQIFSNDLSMP